MSAAYDAHPSHREERRRPPAHEVELCDTNATVRARYFYGMLLEAPDLELDQGFHLEARRRHAAELHGQGTVCGLKVNDTRCEWEIELEPGVAVDCLGRVIRVERSVRLDLRGLAEEAFKARVRSHNDELGTPTGSARPLDPEDRGCWHDHVDLWVGICFEEHEERPVQSLGAPDTCCTPRCESSRVRHGFCLYATSQEPARPPCITDKLDCAREDVREALCRWIIEACRTCEPDPCGVQHHCLTLARIRVLKSGEVLRPDNCIRSLVVSTSALTRLLLFLHEEWKR